jgi:hypothetical protein
MSVYPITQGVELSLNYDPSTGYGDWYKLSDHNRQPIGISYDLIEQADRMANGTLRKYVVARKFKITADWQDFPTLDSNLVDYNGSGTTSSQTPVTTSITTTSITPYVPAASIATNTFSGYSTIGTGSIIFYVAASPIPPVGTNITISGLTNTQSNYLQNGTYTVTQNTGGYIVFSAPGVNVTNISVNGSLTWNTGVPLTTALLGTQFPGGAAGGTWFGTSLSSSQLSAMPSVGNTVTIYGSSIPMYNGVFTVGAVYGNAFFISGLNTTAVTGLFNGVNYSTYFIIGNYPDQGYTSNSTTVTSNLGVPTGTSYSGPYAAAWIKAFYEANAFVPVWVRLIHAKDTNPSSGSIPDPTTYTDSLTSPGQIYQSYMTTFTYDVVKRRQGYDYVNLKIEFTEI